MPRVNEIEPRRVKLNLYVTLEIDDPRFHTKESAAERIEDALNQLYPEHKIAVIGQKNNRN